MREQWVAALRSRLGGDGGPYALLDSAVLTEAVELFESTALSRDIPQTCHLVGTLHWRRAELLGDERAEREIALASRLLLVVHQAGSGGRLPEPLLRSFSRSPRIWNDGGMTWERLFMMIEPLLRNGGDPYSARLVVAAARNAVRGTRPGHPERVGHLALLGAAQNRLFECSGNMAALEEAIEVGNQAVAEAHTDEERVRCLNGLATSLRNRFERTGDLRSLREAVDAGRRALRVTPHGYDRRHVVLDTLGTALRVLYELTGDAASLDEAVEMASAAVQAVSRNVPEAAVLLTNHSAALRARFERTGGQSVLNEAITAARRAVGEAPPGTPLHLACRHNLGGLLKAQFEQTGDLPALDEAIEVTREVVRATPGDHPDAPLYQSALVGQLLVRFEQDGDLAGLDEAISFGHAAVEAAPEDHPNRAFFLNNLAVVLKAMAGHTGDLSLHERAIGFQRLAAGTASGGKRAGILTTLASSLQAYFDRTGDTAALDEAIAVGRDAVAEAPEDSLFRAPCEVNLSGSLYALGLAKGDDSLVDEAIGLLEATAARESARPAIRVEAARRWGRIAMSIGRRERAARGFAAAVGLLPRLATRGLVRADATRWMAEYGRLAGDAAACALEIGRVDQAVELLETGRGVLLAQSMEARADLTDLRDRDAALADRFAYVCGRLDADDTSGDPADGPDRRRELAEELAALVERVRTMPGLDRFLLPPSAARLAAEAHGGPIVMINVSGYRCDALILTTAGVQVLELPDLRAADVRERLTEMHDALGERRPSRREDETEQVMLATLAWLWDTVTGPVLERLGIEASPGEGEEYGRVWWVPCGPLAYFPLHAAGHHLDEPAPHRRTVIDRVVSSYTPTVRALAHARARHARRAARSGPRRPRVLAVVMPQTPGTTDLPGTRREFEQLTGLFPALDGLVGRDATHDAVLSRLRAAAWAHFACHAATDPVDPSGSHLLLHDHARRPLNVLEISRLRLEESEFAYLSACSTAITSVDLADECIHAVSAFQLAGYPHVVGTLWEIGDVVAAEIAASFYEDLASSGYDLARAGAGVHRATRLVRDRYPGTPTLWAAHIHTGA
ncbi:CHAT domain-containing protein [Streptosporangium sp. V21-05]|uniref:CHAT domain-containing protein n=1 Tax=Streptosporangium sp. V21-05 TaxID=3446115 RepID=UPI003F539F4F